MEALLLFYAALCKRVVFLVFLLVLGPVLGAPVLGAKEAVKEATNKAFDFLRNNFDISLLSSGFWEGGKNFGNRLNFLLDAPFSLAFRAQVLDLRLAPPWKDWKKAETGWALALYHKSTGSRVLYGALENSGLASRTRNIWLHGPGWAESHRASSADLKTAVSSSNAASGIGSGSESVYFNLSSPFLTPALFSKAANKAGTENFGVGANISAMFSDENKLFLQGGNNFSLFRHHNIRFEWLYSRKTLPERPQKSWFSDNPHLPERDMEFYALSLMYTHPFFSFSGDFAHSEVFALGRDIYINGGIRVGNRPWRISAALDGAGGRFTGNNAVLSGAGFRIAGKAEFFWKRNMKALAQTIVQSGGIGEPFDCSSSRLSYYFPITRRHLISPSKITLDFERDGRSRFDIKDSMSVQAGFKIGAARSSLRFSLIQNMMAEAGDPIIIYPNFFSKHDFKELKTAFDISFPIAFVTLKASVAYRSRAEKEAVWDKSLSATAAGKLGRLSVRLFSDEKTGALNYRISWRLEKKF